MSPKNRKEENMNRNRMTMVIISTLISVAVLFAWPCKPAAAEKPIVLKIAHHASPRNPFWQTGIAPLCQKLEGKSQGRIKIEYYHAESLLKSVDMWDGTVKGITDLSWTVFAYTPIFPLLNDLAALPFSYPAASFGGKAQLQLYKEGLLDKELDKAIVLGFDPTAPAGILSKQPIKTPADMKGKSFRAAGEMHTKVVKILGGTPVALPIADTYVGLERGVLDGGLTAISPAAAFKLHQICKNYTEVKLGGLATGLVMNKASYQALPKDLQRIVDEVMGGEQSTIFMGKADDAFDKVAARQTFIGAGVNFISLSDTELMAFYDPLQPLWSEWVTNMEAKGLPAKKLVNRWIAIMKDLGYTVPVKVSF
jgi:TRAP-type C4-dicarboxylate transport system substrate-binding protein